MTVPPPDRSERTASRPDVAPRADTAQEAARVTPPAELWTLSSGSLAEEKTLFQAERPEQSVRTRYVIIGVTLLFGMVMYVSGVINASWTVFTSLALTHLCANVLLDVAKPSARGSLPARWTSWASSP